MAKRLRRGETWVQRRVTGLLWRTRNTLPPPSGHGTVIFALPLVAKARSDDWGQVEANLAGTLKSFQNQTRPDWHAYICGQDRPVLPEDDRITFLPFDRKDAFFDKGAKMSKLARHILAEGPEEGYYFPFDADDILHPKVVDHILTDDNGAGYYIDKGYMLHAETGDLAALQPPDARFPNATEFLRSCGSSTAIRLDRRAGADMATLIKKRGAHRKVPRNMTHFGLHMTPIPFYAALYVVGHGENMRQRRGKMAGKLQHLDISPLTAEEAAKVRQDFRLDDLP
ncbi:glycosyltransferase family 2 protein [Aestuariibius sp. 2305UL40-4]|uniref:glycosyltransferase family 2 protein n=1 Tax=Aestuariibius violaceus TaxID=3234132 RepID=UPI00348468A5